VSNTRRFKKRKNPRTQD